MSLKLLIILIAFIVPGTISTINVNVLNTTTVYVQITWLPVTEEEANGNITHYKLLCLLVYMKEENYIIETSVYSVTYK